MKRFAIAIISFNRPHFLLSCLKGLSQNHIEKVDIHFFQDGSINAFSGIQRAKPETIQKSIRLFQEQDFYTKDFLHIRDKNVGIAINQYEALMYLFQSYEYVLVVEDDIVLCPTAVEAWIKAVEQTGDQYPFISLRPFPPEVGSHPRDIFTTKIQLYFSVFGTSKTAWMRDINHNFLKLYKIAKGYDYFTLPIAEIDKKYKELGVKTGTKSQDAWKYSALQLSKKEALLFGYPRAKDIGYEGTHVHIRNPEKIKNWVNLVSLKAYTVDKQSNPYNLKSLQNPFYRYERKPLTGRTGRV